MASLKRSISLRLRNGRDDERRLAKPLPPSKHAPVPPPKPDVAALQVDILKLNRRRSIFGRGKSSNHPSSFGRPVTAARDRQRELDAVKIEIEEGGVSFAFPTPSPLVSPSVPPKSARTFSATPSPLGGNPPSPRTWQEFGSATRGPPARGRAKTSDNVATTAKLQRNALPLRADTCIAEPTNSMRRPALLRKKSSWRTFGGLFSRKFPEPEPKPQPEAKFRTIRHIGPHDERGDTLGPPLPAPPLLESAQPSPADIGRLRTTSGSRSKSPLSTHSPKRDGIRAGAGEACCMPPGERETRPLPSVPCSTQNFMPPMHPDTDIPSFDNTTKPLPERKDSPTDADDGQESEPPLPPLPSLPLRLNLDIPNSELERYSVMFEKLLASRQSIADRRRSKSRKSLVSSSNDTLSDVTPLPPKDLSLVLPPRPARSHRSASSPASKPLPTLSIRVSGSGKASRIFDQQQSTNVLAADCARPRQRSRTAPAGTVLPESHSHTPSAQILPSILPPTCLSSEAEPSLSPSSILEAENSLPPTPSTVTTCSHADGDDLEILRPYAPRIRQENTSNNTLALSGSTLEMPCRSECASKTPETFTSVIRSNLTPRRSVRGKPLAPRVQSTQELEDRIVQVSVARQVSVSRARRHVEMAANKKPLAPPLRPRVVDMGAAKHRKSMFVMVEGGEEV
ncbi:hypothetical protein Tdes44962_MAKER07958 [Teratosphaeria destructans]|uniref:Uncharacterized protein n=1 Tax=Teratosphaeria destructans TaxID=418781 RepID=A0A9W7W581_9PEZI|nr:hypothetical protein Tdes44962_MAKER07958 [Teratosphaeria destructans]